MLEKLKAEMGTYDFSAQYQQAPVPAGGNMIKWEWFALLFRSAAATRWRHHRAELGYGFDDERACELLGRHHGSDRQDTAPSRCSISCAGAGSSRSCSARSIKAAQCHRPKSILIEDHASGTALQQTLKRDGYTVIPIKPKGDKVMRMRAHTATLESGKVLLQKGAPWLDEFRCEVLAFPYGKHDDQVDALSQLMTWAEDRRIPKCSVRHLAVGDMSESACA